MKKFLSDEKTVGHKSCVLDSRVFTLNYALKIMKSEKFWKTNLFLPGTVFSGTEISYGVVKNTDCSSPKKN